MDDVEKLGRELVAAKKQQVKRRKRLQEMVDIHHRSRYGDYDDNYAEFAETYGLEFEGVDYGDEDEREVDADPPQPIPQYASLFSDETYGMIELFDNLTDAVAHQAAGGNGETLNVPSGVTDLDTGKRVEFRVVGLTKAQEALLERVIEDAVYYRLGEIEDDTEDEDEQNDLRVAYEYRKLAEQLIPQNDDN